MVVRQVCGERYAFNVWCVLSVVCCVGKPHDPDVDVPRLLELSLCYWLPSATGHRILHDLFKGPARGFCGAADWIHADNGSAGSDVDVEAFTGCSLPVGVDFGRGLDAFWSGRVDKPVLKLVSISTSAK